MIRPSYRLVRVVLILAFALAVFGIGGVFREVIVVAALCALCAFNLSVFRRRKVTVDAFGILLCAVTLFTALQVVPLPFSLLDWLSHNTADVIRQGAHARGTNTPSFAPISLDPESTRLAIIWWLAVTATYVTTRQLQTRREEQTPILIAIPIFGLLILLSGLVHALIGETTIYGLYEPSSKNAALNAGAVFRSVFLNPNHLAAFLNGGLAISLAWAGASHATGRDRVLWYVTFVILALGVLLTGSRAGILTGIFASLIILLAGGSRYKLAAATAVFILLSMLALILPAGEQLATLTGIDDWSETTHSDAHQLGLEMLTRWPITGVGRGAFGSTHTLLGPDQHHYLTHAHNTPLQFIIDYGWFVGGGILIIAFSLLVRPFINSLRAPLGLGVGAALLALAAHNYVDFSFDILGVALMAAILTASLRNSVEGYKVHWLICTALTTASIIMVIWINSGLGPEAGPRREAVIMNEPVQALDVYPADTYAFLAAGLKTRDAKLIRHAAWLHPKEPRVHIALAALGTPDERPKAISEALSTVRSYQHITSIFTLLRRTSDTSQQVLTALSTPENIAKYIAWLSPADESLLAAAVSTHPESNIVLAQAGRKYLGLGRLIKADDIATRLILLEDSRGYRLMGRVFLAKDKPLRAYHMFIAAKDINSRIRAAEIALDGGLPQRALRALDQVGAEPRHLKKIQLLRDRAKAELAAQKTQPINVLDVFE